LTTPADTLVLILPPAEKNDHARRLDYEESSAFFRAEESTRFFEEKNMHVLASVLGLALAVPAGDEEKLPLPQGPPPTIMVVSGVEADAAKIRFRRVETVFVPFQVAEVVVVNGKNVVVTKTTIKQEIRTVEVAYSLKEAKIRSAAGKDINVRDALKQLKAGTAVLVSETGKDVDRAYLSVVNPDTLVLMIPRHVDVPEPPGVAPPEVVPPPAKN
jgi:hypothetical protein